MPDLGGFFSDLFHGALQVAGTGLGMPMLGVNQIKLEATNPNPNFGQRLGAVVDSAGPANTAITAINNIAPLKFVLDLPNRLVDSMFNGIQTGNLPGDDGSFAKGWSNAWDNWGTENHVSAGEILASQISAIGTSGVQDPLAMDPTTTQGVQGLKQLAHGTWYADIAGGASDVMAGFIGPGAAIGDIARTTRAAAEVRTLAEADSVADALNAAHATGAELKKGSAFFTPRSPRTLAARLDETSNKILDHASSRTDALDYLAPMMQGANEATKRILANVSHSAWKLPSRDYAKHVVANAYLAAMGSGAAMRELVRAEPLIANMIHEVSGPPSLLADVAKAQQLMIEARRTGGDLRPNEIMQQVYDTPRKRAVNQALRESMEKATQDAQEIKGWRQKVYNLKPVQRTKNPDGTYTDNFDTARLKESRQKADVQVSSLKAELAEAKSVLKAKRSEATKAHKAVLRDGTPGPYEKSHQGLGQAQRRVDDLTEQLKQATSDRDLLRQTPLHDADAMRDWKAQMEGARQGTKLAMQRKDTLQALYRVSNRELRDDLNKMTQIRPGLDATNRFLAEIDQLGSEGASFVGRVSPSMLDHVKQGFRAHIGRTYLYQTDPYTPNVLVHLLPDVNKQLANIGTEYGLNRVQTLDRYRGSQELRMALRRSGVYQGAEIKALSDRFIGASPADVQNVIARIHDDMLGRIAADLGLEPEIGRRIVQDANEAMGGVRDFMASALREADETGAKFVHLREFPADDAGGNPFALTTATVRSHLQDSASFLDPYHARRLMKMADSPHGLNWSKLIESGEAGLYIMNYIWKIAVLARPGLFVRNMLDTELRSIALMGMTGAMMSAVNGTLNKVRNEAVKAGGRVMRPGTIRADVLERIGLHEPESLAARTLADKGVSIDMGKGGKATISLYDMTPGGRISPESLAATRSAMSRGTYFHDSLFGMQERITNQLHRKASVWDRYEPGDPRWADAYAEHLGHMMASPTFRAIIKDARRPAPDVEITPHEYAKRLMEDPAVRAEYDDLGLGKNGTPVQYIEQIQHEIDLMFPEPQMIEDILDGKVQGARGKRWIKENFPRGMQFRIPGPKSVFEKRGETLRNLGNAMLTKAFQALTDEPDNWLFRHPVAAWTFKQQGELELQTLLNARRAKYGPDATLTTDDIRKIQARARTKAITTVRNYGYDTTHHTVFSTAMHRVAPFYNVFEDTLRAYSRLIYNDPQLIHTLSGLYNAPTNLSQWLPEPLVVDRNGNPLRPGEEPADDGQRYYVLNSLIGGKKPFGGVTLRIGQTSTNSIMMSEVPILPGWGPVLQVPVTAALNSNQELGLALAESDNPFIRSMMKSFYPGGSVPKGDPLNLLKAFAPPVWRKVFDGYSGDTKWQNVQYGLNQQFIDSLRSGKPFDYRKALDKAVSDANMANTIMLISQGVVGLSGDTSVEGHFYVNQMHILQGIPKEQLKQMGYPSVQAAFSAMFPEAAELDWSFTQNETGVSATLKAQSSALKNKDLINQYPQMGWFVIGGENVGGDFSQTAYNQQKVQGSRTSPDPQEQLAKTHAGMGWHDFNQYMTALHLAQQDYGLDDQTVAALKAMKVDRLAQTNTDWYRDWVLDTGSLKTFYNEADIISALPSMKNRQDMVLYREYRQAQQALLDEVGLKSLGSGYDSAVIRYILNGLGQKFSSQNIGFQQMWDRKLSKDVEVRPSDAEYNIGVSG